MNTKKIEKKILGWFKKKDKKVSVKENFLLNHVIDSFDLIDLIVFIEKEFKTKFKNQDFSDLNFATVNNISKIINKKYEK
tara:strand:+ start:229 stop:468 length:240 start_codon:yes stop_codon:yes gene_type:complete